MSTAEAPRLEALSRSDLSREAFGLIRALDEHLQGIPGFMDSKRVIKPKSSQEVERYVGSFDQGSTHYRITAKNSWGFYVVAPPVVMPYYRNNPIIRRRIEVWDRSKLDPEKMNEPKIVIDLRSKYRASSRANPEDAVAFNKGSVAILDRDFGLGRKDDRFSVEFAAGVIRAI